MEKQTIEEMLDNIMKNLETLTERLDAVEASLKITDNNVSILITNERGNETHETNKTSRK